MGDSPAPVAWLRGDGGGVLILLRVQPGARRSALAGEHGGRLRLAVQAPPVEGQANEAVVQWLADRLGLPQRKVSVLTGHRSREKTVRAEGIDVASALRRLVEG